MYTCSSFCAIVVFNEADTLESSSILLYYNKEQIINTEMRWHYAMFISKNNEIIEVI